jgi:hypothetical protein
MSKCSSRRLDGSTTQTSPQPEPETKICELNFNTQKQYKNLVFSKCYCGTCEVLGIDAIRSIYNLEHIIEDNSPLIFSFLGKALVK